MSVCVGEIQFGLKNIVYKHELYQVDTQNKFIDFQ